MSNPAQEEVDRLFNQRQHQTTHPEDRDSASDEAHSEEERPRVRTIRSSRKNDPEDDDRDNDDEDDDTAANMTSMANTKQSYILPSTTRHANTGPKGVIADAQSYHRAKRNTLQKTLNSLTDNLSLDPKPQTAKKQPSGSDSDLDLSDDDSDFMSQWRQQRLAELQEQYSTSTTTGPSNASLSRRTYGTLPTVTAAGYLDAIEQSAPETVVVVFLFDPHSADSAEVEDELRTLAYKHSAVRFVKLHHEIAEMEAVEIPAILAYRAGDVFATLSGVEAEGLEATLIRARVLSAR